MTNAETSDITTENQASEGEGKLPAEEGQGERTRARPTFRPRVDIAETEDGLILMADVCGANSDGLHVNVEGRELTIRADVDEDTPEGLSPMIREYEVGDYERRFTLSNDLDTDGISAELKNGVLTLRLPKAPEAEARRIDVRPS